MAPVTTSRRLVLAGMGAWAGGSRAWAQSADTALPDGMVGEFHPGVGKGRRPGMLVLGGSEGGLTSGAAGAQRLAALGYSSLGLAYFRAPGLPQTLENNPLETFVRALDWLAKQPSVDPKRIGVLGGWRAPRPPCC